MSACRRKYSRALEKVYFDRSELDAEEPSGVACAELVALLVALELGQEPLDHVAGRLLEGVVGGEQESVDGGDR